MLLPPNKLTNPTLISAAGEFLDTSKSPTRNIIIYADPLLVPSATFVRAQAEELRDFVPYYVGARRYRGAGLELPAERTIAINRKGTVFGKIKEIPFKVFGYAPLFVRKLRRISPVLIHAHTGPGGVVALPLANRLGIPLLTTFHGGDVTTTERSLASHPHYAVRRYSREKQKLQSRGALFIAVSRFVRTKLLQQGYPLDRTVLHYIGIDTALFSPDRQIQREPIVLFVGTLHEGKGCEYAIRAMAKVQSLMPETEFVILGNGPLRSNLEARAKEALRRYTFLGTQPPEVVRHWLNRSKLFLAPSVTMESGWTEAFGLVFAEAQAMGVPVVSSVSGGIPEAVAHEETGLLASERDWEALADHVLLLLKNESIWSRMSEAGRKRVCALFNLKKQTVQLEKLYQEILEDGRLNIESASRCLLESPIG